MTAGRLSGILPFPVTALPRMVSESWLRLSLVPGVSLREQVALLRAFGSPERLFSAPPSETAAVVGERAASRLRQPPHAKALDAALAWSRAPGHHVLAWDDARYPKLLLEIATPPCVLYVRGDPALLSRPAVAIVGSRNASLQGVQDAESFGEALSSAGFAVVSGLALGIDAAAHRGGLRGRGSSIAVVGTGPDKVYPLRNAALAEELAAHGAIVSEFPPGTPPLRENFPRRNRLISGLARGVVVVEAAVASGSLITAHCAAEQGRDVFAIPGSIHSSLSKGCHRLIREGAKLVENAADILEEWNCIPFACDDTAVEDAPVKDRMLQAMGHGPVSIDELVARTGSDAGAVAARLSLLEMRGAVGAIAGGLFQRLSARTNAAKRVIE